MKGLDQDTIAVEVFALENALPKSCTCVDTAGDAIVGLVAGTKPSGTPTIFCSNAAISDREMYSAEAFLRGRRTPFKWLQS